MKSNHTKIKINIINYNPQKFTDNRRYFTLKTNKKYQILKISNVF